MGVFRNKQVIPGVDAEDEFELDATTEFYVKKSGWDRWYARPQQMRLRHELCFGGPPLRVDLYDYAVRRTCVFVRLVERFEEDFEQPEYTVFDGTVLRSRLEEDYAKLVKKYENADDKLKAIMLDRTPDTKAAAIQKQTTWHELYGAIRYFALSHHANAQENGAFFMDESRRYEEQFQAVAQQVKVLGAVWDDRQGWYDAPPGASDQERENIRAKLRVSNFGFRSRNEFLEKDVILGVLKDAYEKQ